MTSQSHEARSTAQIAAILLAVFVQIGATFLPALGLGDPIGDRSDSVRTLITPSGWAFAIWGPLFLGSAIFAVWQALPGQRRNAILRDVGWWAAVALAAQGVWATYTQFNNLTVISALIIITSLVGLLAVVRRLADHPVAFTRAERWVMGLTFSALAAWLTAASIVNISASLVYHGFSVAPSLEPTVTGTILVIGGAIAGMALRATRGNPWYTLVFLWALFAIYMKGGQLHQAIALGTMIAAGLVIASFLSKFALAENRRHWIGF